MIELHNIRKKYGGKLIFENVDLKFLEGTCTAFVGHNGCGKSTLLKVASGLISHNAGKILESKKHSMAYVPEKFPATSMTARMYLTFMAKIDGVLSSKEISKKIEMLSEDFFLEGMLDMPMKNLSKGTLQKIGVIQAIISEPEVLFLDEPLSGQDVDSQYVFVQKIKKLKEQGTIVILSAHEQNLIDELADEVYTFVDGAVVKLDNKRKQKYVVVVTCEDMLEPSEDMTPVEEGKNSYQMICEEGLLATDIQRLQREGWHIARIYEDNTVNQI